MPQPNTEKKCEHGNSPSNCYRCMVIKQHGIDPAALPQEKKCDCKEMSCKKDCDRKHTHKGFFCEKCEPEAVKKMQVNPLPQESEGKVEIAEYASGKITANGVEIDPKVFRCEMDCHETHHGHGQHCQLTPQESEGWWDVKLENELAIFGATQDDLYEPEICDHCEKRGKRMRMFIRSLLSSQAQEIYELGNELKNKSEKLYEGIGVIVKDGDIDERVKVSIFQKGLLAGITCYQDAIKYEKLR